MEDKVRTLADWSVLVYYGLTAMSGVFGMLFDYLPGVDSGPEVSVYVTLAVSFLILGSFGIAARWFHDRRAELIVISTISLFTVIQAGLEVHLTGQAGLSVATRLLAAPLILVPYGLLRQRTVISKRDVAQARRIVARLQEPDDE